MSKLKFIDLFCGIGGFRLGLKRANDSTEAGIQQGIKQRSKSNASIEQPFVGTEQFACDRVGTDSEQGVRNTQGQNKSLSEGCGRGNIPQFHCVWSSDIDKYARRIYKKNFGEEPEGDITKIPAESIPNHDLLCAGFPCQSFSIAGKRKGFTDTRGTLFFDICRILRAKRPCYCLLENVKGLLSHDNGETFKTILESLDELGYDLQWQVLNSKYFGVPQNRERVFIIGHLRGERRPEIFPVGTDNQKNENSQSGKKEQRSWVSCLNSRYGQRWTDESYIVQKARGFNKGGKRKLPTLTDQNYHQNNFLNGIRRLTPVECERLQGFPDNWTAFGIDRDGEQVKISDTQRYKVLGNVVTVNVIEFLGKCLNE